MHSSRMRTARLSGRLYRGVCLWNGGCLPLGLGVATTPFHHTFSPHLLHHIPSLHPFHYTPFITTLFYCPNVKSLPDVGLHWHVPFIEDPSETVQVVW